MRLGPSYRKIHFPADRLSAFTIFVEIFSKARSMAQNSPAATVGTTIGEASCQKNGYETFFNHLLSLVQGSPIDQTLGKRIESYVGQWTDEHPLTDFNDYSATSYRRTYLGRCPETGWEALAMSWRQGNRTSVHAHPQFAGYYFTDGLFRLEVFEPVSPRQARLKESTVIQSPHGFFAIGQAGHFDNHIHRITCLSDTGHSLHVYSADALHGLVYQTIE